MSDALPSQNRDQLVHDEIVDCARVQLVDSGAAGLSMRAIATQLGVTPPALYRHVGSRRALLDLLASEAAEQFVAPFAQPRSTPNPAEHLLAVTTHARDWARSHRAQYLLAFADSDGRVPDGVAAAERRALAGLIRACTTLPMRSGGPRPAPRPSRTMAPRRSVGDEIAWRRARQVWTRLHGVLVLELLGHLAALDTDAADQLEHEIRAVIRPATVPDPMSIGSVRVVDERE